jgi:hypothetical protein
MVKSPWVYRRLRNFRAGIEAAISCFKRAYGAAPPGASLDGPKLCPVSSVYSSHYALLIHKGCSIAVRSSARFGCVHGGLATRRSRQ